MATHLSLWIALLAAIALVDLVGPRLRLPTPVLLVLAGAALTVMPGVPHFRLDPDLILLAFLPPVLYADAFDTSWVDFRRWLRPILSLAIGLVAFTILCVGLVAHAVLPGLPWPVCFILGAIVSPTDTIAVQAVIERLRVPRRMTAIVGGESLVNDATGLVGVQIGVAVVLSGVFQVGEIALDFAWVAGGGVAIGAVAGLAFTQVNRVVRDTKVLFVLSLIAPYLAFWIAHEVGTSGVLAVVVAGFLVSWKIHQIAAHARVDLYTTWELVVYLLNGLCFLFIGLEIPHLFLETPAEARWDLARAGLCVSAVVIVARIVWTFPAAYIPLLVSRKLREHEGGLPKWRNVALVSWCGARGVVSLAAALALPYALDDGAPFPGRNEILVCTLSVILVTLVVQASTLLPFIRLLGIREDDTSAAEMRQAREALLAAGIARLDEFCSEQSCPIAVHHFRELMADELTALKDQDVESRERASVRLSVSQEVRRAVMQAQEAELLRLRDQGVLNDITYVDLQLDLDRAHRAPSGEHALA